jgi:hypothetical protein
MTTILTLTVACREAPGDGQDYTPWGIISVMCRQVACKRCEKASWAGCGQHVNQVLAGVPKNQRCKCTAQEMAEWKKDHSFFKRLFGGARSSA